MNLAEPELAVTEDRKRKRGADRDAVWSSRLRSFDWFYGPGKASATCICCGRKQLFRLSVDGKAADCDFYLCHVIAHNKNGAEHKHNLIVACKDCNRHHGHSNALGSMAEVPELRERLPGLLERLMALNARPGHSVEATVAALYDPPAAPCGPRVYEVARAMDGNRIGARVLALEAMLTQMVHRLAAPPPADDTKKKKKVEYLGKDFERYVGQSIAAGSLDPAAPGVWAGSVTEIMAWHLQRTQNTISDGWVGRKLNVLNYSSFTRKRDKKTSFDLVSADELDARFRAYLQSFYGVGKAADMHRQLVPEEGVAPDRRARAHQVEHHDGLAEPERAPHLAEGAPVLVPGVAEDREHLVGGADPAEVERAVLAEGLAALEGLA